MNTKPLTAPTTSSGKRGAGPWLACGLGSLGWVLASPALANSYSFDQLHRAIPDHDPAGAIDSRLITDVGTVNSVKVNLKLSGDPGFNGDLYAYLQHGTGFSVLLNRVGRDVGRLDGYDDNGFDVTFADDALADIHAYRVALNGDDGTPVDPNYIDPVRGEWQPSGRNVSPFDVLAGSSRNALLSSFVGLPLSGEWNLFVADLASGASFQLESWGLEIDATTGPHVPESGFPGALALLGTFAGWCCWRRRSG